jgi:putative endonuclease
MGRPIDGVREQRSTRERGNEAEDTVAEFLVRQGYQVLERNYRWRGGEIDIVARDRGTLVFVEVRSRAHDGFLDPILSVTPAKLSRIVRTAEHYRLARQTPPSVPCRFDIAGVRGKGRDAGVTLVRNAFAIDDLPKRSG